MFFQSLLFRINPLTKKSYTCEEGGAHLRTVPEIQSETDRIFCPFGPFFALIPPHNNLAN